jgi:hypothetical protein
MAQKVNIIMVDDIDGGQADEAVSFGLDDTNYEIDLSSQNAAALRDALAPYVAAARKVRGRRDGGRSGDDGVSAPTVSIGRRHPRLARENGRTLSDRGRVPAEIREAYNAAH